MFSVAIEYFKRRVCEWLLADEQGAPWEMCIDMCECSNPGMLQLTKTASHK